MAVEEYNLPQENLLFQLRYRNIPRVELQLFRLGEEEWKKLHDRLYQRSSNMAYIHRQKALRSWTVDLPDSGNYQTQYLEQSLALLEMGYYALLVDSDQKWRSQEAAGSFCLFRVSATQHWYRQKGTVFELQQVSAKQGKPQGPIPYLQYAKSFAPQGLFQLERAKWTLMDSLASDAQGRLEAAFFKKILLKKLKVGAGFCISL